jgi:ABC-type multidrug transport system fused ATPase/permease subunit
MTKPQTPGNPVQVPPALAAVLNGQAAASRITRLRARKPRIDASSVDGRIMDLSSAPRLSLENVRFAYPTRGDAEVLRGVSLTVPPGKTLALVGQSGSGKSTVVQLVMRLYDPTAGCVLLDGEDVRLFNVRWLRRQIGLVSQEPVLFSASVFENVRINCREATRGDVEEACKKASVHDFIRGLSQGYDTMCGERGSQMSGGQKQRIAIARAVVSNPRILLLDEATSALDTESERLVQAALNQNFGGKTVISIAHRLSTIRGAHVIAVMDKGRIVEEGTHEELSAKEGGVYAGYISSGNHNEVSSDAREGNVEFLDIVASPRSPNRRPEMSSQISTAFGATTEYRRKSSLLGVIGPAAVGGDPGNGLMPPHDFGADADQGGRIRLWHAGGWVWIRTMSLCVRENPLWSALALLSLVAGGSVAPLLCWILVEGVTILFRCFLIDMPTMFGSWRGEDYQLISFFGFGIPCESSCLLDFAVSGSPMGTVGGARCSLRNWDTLCMDFGSFSVKFWDVASRGQCYDEMMVEIRPLLWGVGGLGIGASILTCVQVLSLGLLSRRLGSRLREMSYASLLRQRIGFFDLEENASGTLAGRIMADATCVESAVSNVLGSVLVNMICVIGSIVVGFTRGYLLTAICLVVFPAKFLVMVIWSFIRYLTETNIKVRCASTSAMKRRPWMHEPQTPTWILLTRGILCILESALAQTGPKQL